MAGEVFVFLDIDGVLAPIESHPPEVAAAAAPRPIDPDCAAYLVDAIAAYPRARIVISSSWRLVLSLDAIRALLPPALAERVVATTPDVGRPERLREIRAWLERSGHEHSPFIIVDDSPYLFPAGAVRVSPSGSVGFDRRCADRLALELERLGAGQG